MYCDIIGYGEICFSDCHAFYQHAELQPMAPGERGVCEQASSAIKEEREDT